MAKGPGGVAQHNLLPPRSLWEGPFDTGSADAPYGCFCDDGHGYVTKPSTAANGHAPHCEWLCARMAVHVGVPVHDFEIVEAQAGDLRFGSRYEPREIKDWWLLVIAGSIKLDDLKEDISRIYALDLFLHNADRHMRNYFVRAVGDGHRIWALDHGRAWMFNGFPPPALPMTPGDNTVLAREWMKEKFAGFQCEDRMIEVVDKIKSVTDIDIGNIISAQPDDWLSDAEKDAILLWWKDGKAAERAEVISKGIADGTLL